MAFQHPALLRVNGKVYIMEYEDTITVARTGKVPSNAKKYDNQPAAERALKEME